jgi:regulatory protein
MDLMIFNKAAAFCAYQERSHKEVRDRLGKWGIYGSEADEIISELIVGNYLSEERFAKAYAGGKSRMKQWGRLKIRLELQRRGVSEYSIGQGIKEIDDTDYKSKLTSLLEKKSALLRKNETDKRVIEQKLFRYAMGKGYEADVVRECMEKMVF